MIISHTYSEHPTGCPPCAYEWHLSLHPIGSIEWANRASWWKKSVTMVDPCRKLCDSFLLIPLVPEMQSPTLWPSTTPLTSEHYLSRHSHLQALSPRIPRHLGISSVQQLLMCQSSTECRANVERMLCHHLSCYTCGIDTKMVLSWGSILYGVFSVWEIEVHRLW